MASFVQWLSMGGYAIYIWPAYGLVCSFLVINLLGIHWQSKRVHQLLTRWFRHETRT